MILSGNGGDPGKICENYAATCTCTYRVPFANPGIQWGKLLFICAWGGLVLGERILPQSVEVLLGACWGFA